MDRTERIVTERLRLDPQTVEDAVEMSGVLSDPALYRFIGGSPPTIDDVLERFAKQAAGRSPDGTEEWRNWIIRRRADEVAVGTVQATIAHGVRAADVAWVIGTTWQGRGYATEAASALVAWLLERRVRTVQANIHPDHAASEAVARRAGLVQTSRMVDGERVWRRRAGTARHDGGESSFEELRPDAAEVAEE
jgi:RimJ/RimL family protein N-acetyltransferase